MYTIREIGENIKNSCNFNGDVFFDESLKNRTTMRVGGNAALLLEPFDTASLIFVLRILHSANCEKIYVIGGGSNIIAPDNELHFPVISLKKIKSTIELNESVAENGESQLLLKCSCGTSWGEIFTYCIEHKIGGLLTFTGLPGTVGGACFMNASCFGCAISDVLESAEYVSENGEAKIYSMSAEGSAEKNDEWGYKKSPFQTAAKNGEKRIVTSAVFKVFKTADDVRSVGLSYLEKRKEKGHYKKPSAGSVFRNPEGEIAGKLIDECGLKGFCIGGAKIADWHANIIINENNASQAEIKELVDYIVNRVNGKKSIKLIPEIIFW